MCPLSTIAPVLQHNYNEYKIIVGSKEGRRTMCGNLLAQESKIMPCLTRFSNYFYYTSQAKVKFSLQHTHD